MYRIIIDSMITTSVRRGNSSRVFTTTQQHHQQTTIISNYNYRLVTVANIGTSNNKQTQYTRTTKNVSAPISFLTQSNHCIEQQQEQQCLYNKNSSLLFSVSTSSKVPTNIFQYTTSRYNKNNNNNNILLRRFSSSVTNSSSIPSQEVGTKNNDDVDKNANNNNNSNNTTIIDNIQNDTGKYDNNNDISVLDDGDNDDNNNKHNNTDDEFEIVLYQRDTSTVIGASDESKGIASQTLFLMKSGLVFSIFNTMYWFWYAIDFVPLVNSSPIPELHINTAFAYIGIVFGCTVQIAFLTYPTRYASKLTWKPLQNTINIYTHTIPFIRTSTKPTISFITGGDFPNLGSVTKQQQQQQQQQSPLSNNNPIGLLEDDVKYKILGVPIQAADTKKSSSITTSSITSFFSKKATTTTASSDLAKRPLLDPDTSRIAKYILNDLNGEIQNYKGHIPLGYKWPYYVIDIQSPYNVPEPELLLEALVRTQYMVKEFLTEEDYTTNTRNNNNNNNSNRRGKSKNKTSAIATKQGKKAITASTYRPGIKVPRKGTTGKNN